MARQLSIAPERFETVMLFVGEIAALTTALCWSFTSILFAESGKLIGAFRVNNIRLVMASVIYTVMVWATFGSLWPVEFNTTQLLLLTLSALIGLVLGDLAGFKALVMIGPRITTLLWSTAPVMVVVIAWLFLGEALRPIQIIGIIVTLVGVGIVVYDRSRNSANDSLQLSRRTLWIGVSLGLIAALGQGLGLVISKQAMLYSGDELPPMPASYVRMLSAMLMSWLITAGRGKLKHTLAGLKHGKAMAFASGGAFFGPFLGVWMSLVAVIHIEAGIASTLNAMTPIMILPLMVIIYKEKLTWVAIMGAVLSVVGVVMLMLDETIEGWF